jgi:hypothetical protein
VGYYLTSTSVQAALSRIVSVYKDSGVVDTAKIDADIAAVEAYMHSAIRSRYAVPVTDSEAIALLTGLGFDLMRERAQLRGPSGNVPDDVTAAADVARATLREIMEGKRSLPGQEEGREEAYAETNTPRATRTKLKGL